MADRWLTVHEVNVHVKQKVLAREFNSTRFRFERDFDNSDWTRISWTDGPAVQWVDDAVREFTMRRWDMSGNPADLQQIEIAGITRRKRGFSPIKGYLLTQSLSVSTMEAAEELWAQAVRDTGRTGSGTFYGELEVEGVAIGEGWMAQQVEEIAKAVVLGHRVPTTNP